MERQPQTFNLSIASTRGLQQGEILDAGAEIRDTKSLAIFFSNYRSCEISMRS